MSSELGPAGFIGLGAIGAGMASCLLDWPDGLVVCDVSEDATKPFADKGATVAATPADVARAGATVISIAVLTDAQVRDVILGEHGIAAAATPGTVIAVHSTIEPETAEELAGVLAERDISILDAPCTGGLFAAYEGKICFMLGGDADAVERCRPVLEQMSELIIHAGPLGAATKLKIARNLLTFVGYAAQAEASRIAEASGLSLRDLAAAVKHSDMLTGGPAAIMHRDVTGPMAADDGLLEPFRHTVELGRKDLQLAIDLAAEHGVDTPFSTLAQQLLGNALGIEST